MRNEYLYNIRSKQNSGYALVSILIVVTFISLLATSILYLSGVNFKMKYADYSTKESFYESEEVLEAFRVQLICDVATAVSDAVHVVSTQYVQLGSESARQTAYETAFRNSFENLWKNHWLNAAGNYSYSEGITNLFPGVQESTIDSSTVDTDGVVRFKFTCGTNTYDVAINEVATTGLFAYYGDGDPSNGQEALTWHDIKLNPEQASLTNVHGSGESTDIAQSYRFKRSYYTIDHMNIVVTNSNDYTSILSTSFYVVPPSLNLDSQTASSDTKPVDFTKCVNYLNWSKE